MTETTIVRHFFHCLPVNYPGREKNYNLQYILTCYLDQHVVSAVISLLVTLQLDVSCNGVLAAVFTVIAGIRMRGGECWQVEC